ncbi:MAG: PfkB family carbohydrate kinase [Paracoccaceae bacterium]
MRLMVVGSLHLDVLLHAPHLPALDETVAGSTVDYVFGGKGGNQALAAARLGASVSFAGRAGSDSFGDILRETLRSSRIDVSQMQRDTGPSGMSAAIVDSNGDYGAVIVSAANLEIEPDPIRLPDDTALVLLQNEVPESVNLAMARKARAQGAKVWLNAAPARALSKKLGELVDLIIVNRVEESALTEISTPAEILTTLGPEGVEYCGTRYPGHKVKVISTHGAGDTFVGALATRVTFGDDIQSAIPFAQGAAALHISTPREKRPDNSAAKIASFLAQCSQQ